VEPFRPGRSLRSAFIPDGVISKVQATIIATTKPTAMITTKDFITDGGTSNVGKRIDAAWMSSHAITA
jgi:hypothetical protein